MSRSESPSSRSPASSLRPVDRTAEALELALCVLNEMAPTADNVAYLRHTATAPPLSLSGHAAPQLAVPKLKDRSEVLRECIALSTGLPLRSEVEEIAVHFQLPDPQVRIRLPEGAAQRGLLTGEEEEVEVDEGQGCATSSGRQWAGPSAAPRQCDVPMFLAEKVCEQLYRASRRSPQSKGLNHRNNAVMVDNSGEVIPEELLVL